MHLIYIWKKLSRCNCITMIVLILSCFWGEYPYNLSQIYLFFWLMSSSIFFFTGENTILKKEDLYPLFMISRLCMSLKAIIMPDRCFNFWSKIAKIVDNQNIFSNVLSWIEFYLNPSKSLLDNVLRVDYLQSSYRKYLLSIKRNYDLKSLNL